jgi:hypothetical protein
MMKAEPVDSDAVSVNVVLNWFAELKRFSRD